MTSYVPRPALVLGAAGLLPPLALTIVAWFGISDLAPIAPGFVRSYAAIILSFLGGTWWGFALREQQPPRPVLIAGVIPALAGWTAMFWFQPAEALFALAGLLMGSLLLDAWLVRGRLVPAWWMRLRVPLSSGLALCCLISGWTLTR